MPFRLLLCKVIATDIYQRTVQLEHIDKQIGISKEVVRFGAPYAPIMAWTPHAPKDPFSTLIPQHPLTKEPLNSSPAGMFSYPKPGELVLVAGQIDEEGRQGPFTRSTHVSWSIREVIIICRVFDNPLSGSNAPTPAIGMHDQLWLDRSGAKIHFNHPWNDTETRNILKDREVGMKENEPKIEDIPAPQGHLTIVGNRRVDLIGDKWMGFGLFSHLFRPGKGKEIIIPKTNYPPEEEGQSYDRAQLFSKDLSKAYEPNFGEPVPFTQGENYWLEPPCPESGAYMRLHQSGQKLHISNVVGLEGQEVRFLRNRVEYIGSAGFPLSVDPNKESGHSLTESTTEGSTVASRDSHEFTQWVSGGASITGIATSLMKADGLKTVQLGGLAIEVPSSLPTTFGTDPTYVAEAGKVKIRVGDNITIVIDSGDDSVTFTLGAGKLFKVIGDIEATGDVKGATGTFGTPPP